MGESSKSEMWDWNLAYLTSLNSNLIIFYEKRTGIYIQQESVPSIVGLNETQYVRSWRNEESRFRWFYGV